MLTYTKIEDFELADRYPDWKPQIQRLADTDPAFRDICQNYDDVARFLQHERRAAPPNAQMIESYRTLLHDLEVQALVYLMRPASP